MVSRFEQKNFITTRNVVTTKPTQVNLLNVVNTQTFSELIHKLLNILYILYSRSMRQRLRMHIQKLSQTDHYAIRCGKSNFFYRTHLWCMCHITLINL
jgi:hypothetical protein